MKDHSHKFVMQEYSVDEISDEKIRQLIRISVDYLEVAYAPYSKFQVGAAVLTEEGQIFGGANFENASYSLCMCGERNALYHARMASPSSTPLAVAITAKTPNQFLTKPVMPCGACRQVILEFEYKYGKNIAIYLLTNDNKVFKVDTIKDLLPYSFDGSFL
jgi:cytidine deaminase